MKKPINYISAWEHLPRQSENISVNRNAKEHRGKKIYWLKPSYQSSPACCVILQNHSKNWMQKEKKGFVIESTQGHQSPFYHKPKATLAFQTRGKKAEWLLPHIDMSQTLKIWSYWKKKKEGELWGFCFPFFWQQGRDRREWDFGKWRGLGHGRRRGQRKEKNNCLESNILIQIHLSSTGWKAGSEVERISGCGSRQQKYLNLCWAMISWEGFWEFDPVIPKLESQSWFGPEPTVGLKRLFPAVETTTTTTKETKMEKDWAKPRVHGLITSSGNRLCLNLFQHHSPALTVREWK